MSSILTLMIITVYMEIIPGILNDKVTVSVTKGERVVLKCCGSGDVRTWLGPDINNATTGNEVYFLNNDTNPKVDLSNHILQINDRNYDLIILNFQNKNTGLYVCRFLNNGGFHETKFNVILKDASQSTFSTLVYDEGRNSVPNATYDWETNATQITEDNPCSCNSIPNYEYWKVSGGFVAGIIVCLICSNIYCYKKRKKASKDISEVQREVQYDEIGSMNCNIVNIRTLRDDTRDRMTVMPLSGINIDTLSSKSPTLSYSSTNDSLSKKTEGSENTYESINLDQNHEFKKCEASTTTLTSLYENTVVFPLRSEKIKGDVNDKTPWLFIYNRMAHVEHSL